MRVRIELVSVPPRASEASAVSCTTRDGVDLDRTGHGYQTIVAEHLLRHSTVDRRSLMGESWRGLYPPAISHATASPSVLSSPDRLMDHLPDVANEAGAVVSARCRPDRVRKLLEGTIFRPRIKGTRRVSRYPGVITFRTVLSF